MIALEKAYHAKFKKNTPGFKYAKSKLDDLQNIKTKLMIAF